MSAHLAMTGIVDWEQLTGQSRFVIELVTFPIFSAIAGVLTNWTGVLMLFRPARFHGFKCPGLETLFPFLPRWIQVLPIFAPGGILGFQAIIAARAEKMASVAVDQTLGRIGKLSEIMDVLEQDRIIVHVVEVARRDLPAMVEELMLQEHPQLWAELSPRLRQVVVERVEDQLPEIVERGMERVKGSVDSIVDARLLAVGFLRNNPEALRSIVEAAGAPELRFMVRIGLLGAPFGLFLALVVHVQHHIPFLSGVPTWVFILSGAALIGALVNVIAIKVVFTPGLPQPRYKCLWKQARMAKRQPQAAADIGHALAYEVLTMQNLAEDLLNGPRGDKARMLIADQLRREINNTLGPVGLMVRLAVGSDEFEAMQRAGAAAAIGFAPKLLADAEFTTAQSEKVAQFATQKLQELPPDEFMDILLSAIEQDAWLLYVHGGLLGVLVGIVHLAIFGA